jgi:hypothetical protein
MASGTMLVAVAALPLGSLSAISAGPPSSLEPPPATAGARFAYVHQVVRECLPKARGVENTCVEKAEPARAQTQLELWPIREADLASRRDERELIRVALDSANLGGLSLELRPGLWELRWPGHERVERFTVDAGDGLEVALRSTAGRCELATDGKCRVLRNSRRGRIDISLRRRESS